MYRTRYFSTLVILLSLAACSSISQQSLRGPGWYLVKPTDTLYSIAWRYGLDYQDLAQWNGIGEPYLIKPGQQLVLVQPQSLPAQPATMATADRQTPRPGGKSMPSTSRGLPPTAKQETGRAPAKVKSLTTLPDKVVSWRWPTDGKLLNRFSSRDLSKRGIDIAGKIGQPVYAVADGKVVYSGTGLADYGNLIIVKHNSTFLSAYAFNKSRLVKEGMQVKSGAKIALMGTGKSNQAMLHFQIRKKGKPVDPLSYLPDR